MPRRNRRGGRAYVPAGSHGPAVEKPISYQALAHDLVKRGLASPLILGPQPKQYGRKQQHDNEGARSE